MINRDIRSYDYYTYGEKNQYGQETLSTDVKGTIKMAIYSQSTTLSANVKYRDAKYIGFTQDKTINDKYVIQYGEEKLKVLYIIPFGRYSQIFLGAM